MSKRHDEEDEYGDEDFEAYEEDFDVEDSQENVHIPGKIAETKKNERDDISNKQTKNVYEENNTRSENIFS